LWKPSGGEALLREAGADLPLVLEDVLVEVGFLSEARWALFARKPGIFQLASERVLASVNTNVVVEVVKLSENLATVLMVAR
jgi:hypothetical protein